MARHRFVKLITSVDSYSTHESARHSFTVGELIDELGNYNPEDKIVFWNDGGYSQGIIDNDSFCESYYRDDE